MPTSSSIILQPGEVGDFLCKLQESGPEDRVVAEKTSKGREDAYKRWNKFWELQCEGVDPDHIWVDLCGTGARRTAAIRCCQTYLSFTAARSVTHKVSLDDDVERQKERSFNHASALLSLWRYTVLAFNNTVFARKRWEDPDNANRFILRMGSENVINSPGYGPAAEIVRVFSMPSTALRPQWMGAYAKEMGLSCEQSFTKREATTDDVALLLQVLWQSAGHILCGLLVRISFHFIVLIGSIGGFRPGLITDWKYRDVCIELIRDPQTSEKSLVATLTVPQDKQN